MRNLRFLIEYEGTRYCGWQRQAEETTVQGVIENAARTLLREEVSLIGAGRTDAGVHARGQVANCRTGSRLETERVQKGLNALLPDDIVVLEAADVPESFHARFDAVGRRYSYELSMIPSALERHRIWQLRYRLDPDPMSEAARIIIGTHDFSSFCRAESETETRICTIREARWYKPEKGRLTFSISADRFLHGMVRALVGTMVDVGRGYTSIERFREILGKKNRSDAGPAAPANGLTLEEVYYEADGIPER